MVASRSSPWVWCALALALGSAGNAWSDYRDSFRDASQSGVKYTTRVARAALSCESLRSKTEYGYTVISARRVPAHEGVPEYCELHGVIVPEVQFWLYFPTDWNGRLYMVGHGGYAGMAPKDIEYFNMKLMAGVRSGFAAVFTNTGHDAAYEPGGTFAYNEVQKTLDYAYRAVHLTALTAKGLVNSYYKRAPAFSYFDGCSTGGRQGLMEAQRFPDDFDGIVAGAPVNTFTDLHIWMAWIYQALEKTPITPQRVLDILAPNVLRVCDSLDAAKDGLIQNPAQCPFKPSKDLPVCEQGGASCFSPAEIATLERIYGPVMSKGKPYFPGMQVGVEPAGMLNFGRGPVGTGWLVYTVDQNGGPGNMRAFADAFFKYLAFRKDDPSYDWRKLDFDEDLDEIASLRSIMDAAATDMSAFKARGGKIISYHGWADGGPPASFTVKYYEDVLSAMGEENTKEFYRLFMVPGLFHCVAGFGPDRFDPMTKLINWVEAGVAPDNIHAEELRDGRVTRSRPLCPYPQISRYKGSGDMNDSRNFVCSNQMRGSRR